MLRTGFMMQRVGQTFLSAIALHAIPMKQRRGTPWQTGMSAPPAILFATMILFFFGSFSPAAGPAPKLLDSSINRGVKFLLERQKEDGSWSDEKPDARIDVGRTSLVCMALINAGESHQAPALRKAIDYLRSSKTEFTYSIGLRAAFFSLLPEAIRKNQLDADTRWLLGAAVRRGDSAGMYSYTAAAANYAGVGGDYSNSQYGLLGVWYAAASGQEIPGAYWRTVERAWLNGQADDGGWGYTPGAGAYGSMTAAGLATLYVTYDYVHAQSEKDLSRPVAAQRNLARGVKWLADYFAVSQNPGKDFGLDGVTRLRGARRRGVDDFSGSYIYYMLFGYERVGEASGLTRFGDSKWFDEGCEYLLDRQEADGGWPGSDGMWMDVNTAYALLFLSRGRAPVALQKLDFSRAPTTQAESRPAARWNNRSRDAAQLAKWLSRQTERHLNWQIVTLNSTLAELRESPILYLASDRPISLPEEALRNIRQFVLQGGVLLCVNEGKDDVFAKSIERMGKQMFPKYDFRDLPPEHLLFTANFPAKDRSMTARALSNGVRELIVLLPQGDTSWRWQSGAGTTVAAKAPHFGFAGNLHLYMTDRANPRFKGDEAWIDRDESVAATGAIKLARLLHNGNADPEPAGWERLANILHNRDQIDLQWEAVDPVRLPADAGVAHITSTDAFKLYDEQVQRLRTYLDHGGLLLADAAGGSSTAAASIEDLLRSLYPAGKLEPLPFDHAIYTGGGPKLMQVSYRKFAMDKLPRTTLPRLRGLTINGRLVAVVSNEDLSSGLVGHAVDGIVGYSSESAVELVRAIVLWRTK